MTRIGVYTLDLGGILVMHKSSSECLHCGANIIEPLRPCPYCTIDFKSVVITYTDEQAARDLSIDSELKKLRFIGYAAGGSGKWHITTHSS